MANMPTSRRRAGESSSATFVAMLGILSVLAGAVALAFPAITGAGVVLFIGFFLALAGFVHIVDGLRAAPERHYLEALIGTFYLVMGVLFLLQPLASAISLMVLLAFLLWVGGAFRLAAAWTGEATHRALAGLGGVCAVILGFLVLRATPVQAVWVIGLFVGIELLFSGLSMIRLSRVPKATYAELERFPLNH